MSRNAVTLQSTGQVLRIGNTDFFNDGSFNAIIETSETNVSKLAEGVQIQFNKIVASVCLEMSQPEKDFVDSTEAQRIQDNAIGATRLILTYPDVDSLPLPVPSNGLIVRVEDTGEGEKGFAISINDEWKVFSASQGLLARFAAGFPETISSNTALSLDSYVSRIQGNNREVTLADSNINHLTKLINTNGGSSCTITCSLEAPNVSIDLPASSKVRLLWLEEEQFYSVIDEKGSSFNT